MPGPPDLTTRGKSRWVRFFDERSDGEWHEVKRTTRRQTPYQLRARFRRGVYKVPGKWEMEVARDEETGEWVLWARKR